MRWLFLVLILAGCSFEDPGVSFFTEEKDDVGLIPDTSTFDSSSEEDSSSGVTDVSLNTGNPDEDMTQEDEGTFEDMPDLPCNQGKVQTTEGCVPDLDGDGIPDLVDNCPNTFNPSQTDTDEDGVGDVCDNCPNTINPDQRDSGSLGVGDKCSPIPQGMVCGTNTFNFEEEGFNVYLLLDRSWSMGYQSGSGINAEPMASARQGLDYVAGQFDIGTQFAFGSYQTGSCPGLEVRLSMSPYSLPTLKAAWQGLLPGGSPSMGSALGAVRAGGHLNSTASNDVSRKRILILFTAGMNNQCGGVPELEALNMFSENVHVFVVGYNFSGVEPMLNAVAQAGGTNNFYTQSNLSQMTQDIKALGQTSISCTQQLTQVPQDEDLLWVSVGGNPVPKSNVVYDSVANTVSVTGTACTQLRNLPSDTNNAFVVTMGCN